METTQATYSTKSVQSSLETWTLPVSLYEAKTNEVFHSLRGHFGIIYVLMCVPTGKQYVGQTKIPKRRFSQYINKSAKNTGSKLVSALNTYGIENFTVMIIDYANSKKELNELEKKWIRAYDSVENGLNVQYGGYEALGFEGRHHTEASKKKISDAKRGRKHTPEHNAKKANFGNKNGMKNKTVEQVWIDKFGEEIGNKMWDDFCAKRRVNQKKAAAKRRKIGDDATRNEIYKKYMSGISRKMLAAEYNCGVTTIARIIQSIEN